jgi:uncharacterized membrane-anchored protein YjiN (DUF445 family)
MRYRNWANRILAGVCLLFGLSAIFKYYYVGNLWADLLFMVCEAAVIGSVADWFAVTALFRKPLGFPWHTALIPRNRDRVIRSVVDMVEQDLLSVDAIKKRLADVCFMNLFVDWVENKRGKVIVGSFTAKTALHFLETLDAGQLSMRAERFARAYLRDLLLLPRLRSLGDWAVQHGKVEQLFELMIDELVYVVEKPSTLEAIYRYLSGIKEEKTTGLAAKVVLWLGEHTDSVNVKEAARALQREMLATLEDLRDPGHPIHTWAVKRITESMRQMEQKSSLEEVLFAWAAQVMDQLSFHELINRILLSAIVSLKQWIASAGTEEAQEYPPLMLWVFDQVQAYWDSFKEDPDIHFWVERYVKKSLFRLIETEHHLIGCIVQDALEEFDNEDLSTFIEDKAGDDLQWIRINGSIVGGFVGLLLFLFLRLVYDPFFVPLIRSWLL